MRARRTLALRRETLTELATAELTAVVAGAVPKTLPLNDCLLSRLLTGCGPSVNPKCPGLDD